MSKLKLLELFGGIGACSRALDHLGIEYELVDYVEIDKYACKSFNAIHGTDFKPQDVKEWDKKVDVDLIMHGSPCQDFSIGGKGKGGNEGSGTRSSLMYETVRIVSSLKPKYVLWENVKNLLSEKHRYNFDMYLDKMEELGYRNYYQVLNAKDYGVPQNRERVFTVSIRKDIKEEFVMPKPFPLDKRLKDLLEDEVDESYYISEKMKIAILGNVVDKNLKDYYDRSKFMFNPSVAYSLCIKPDRRIGDSNYIIDEYGELNVKEYLKIKNATKKGYHEAKEGDYINLQFTNSTTRRGRVGEQQANTLLTSDEQGVVTKELRIRKLTPRECWRLMGFDDEAFEKAREVNSDTQLYKQAGNSIVVDVLEAILTNLLINPHKLEKEQMSMFDFIER